MKGNRIIKWMFALIVAAIIGFFGFVFKVNEGEYAVVTRFGAVRSEVTQAGMYLRLPWPFEDVQIQDARKRYLDSGYLETLTHDKKNVIMQTYTIWSIADPLRYYTSVGDTALAETYLSDLVTSAKNGTMGNYDLSALVSLDEEDIKIDEIEAAMKGMLAPKFREAVIGHAEVRQTYKVSAIGTIAGCYVKDGKVTRDSKVRVLRDNIVIYEGEIGSLQRFKDSVKEVAQNYECGMSIDKFNDIKEGDIFECYVMEEIPR